MNKTFLFIAAIAFAVSCSSKEEKKDEKKDEPKEEATPEEAAEEVPEEETIAEDEAPSEETNEEAPATESKNASGSSTPAHTTTTGTVDKNAGVKSKGVNVKKDITVGEEGVK